MPTSAYHNCVARGFSAQHQCYPHTVRLQPLSCTYSGALMLAGVAYDLLGRVLELITKMDQLPALHLG